MKPQALYCQPQGSGTCHLGPQTTAAAFTYLLKLFSDVGEEHYLNEQKVQDPRPSRAGAVAPGRAPSLNQQD